MAAGATLARKAKAPLEVLRKDTYQGITSVMPPEGAILNGFSRRVCHGTAAKACVLCLLLEACLKGMS